MESLYFNNIIVVLGYEHCSDSLNRVSLSIVSVMTAQIFFTSFLLVSVVSCLDRILFRGCAKQAFLDISLLLRKKDVSKWIEKCLTTLRGSPVKSEFLGLLENLPKEASNAAMPEKFSKQDSAMLHQANKLAYSNEVKRRTKQSLKQEALCGIYSCCGCI